MAAFQGEISSVQKIYLFVMFWYLRISICSVYGADDESRKITLLRDTVTVSTCPGEQLLFKCALNATQLRWIVIIPIVQNEIGSRTITHTSEMITGSITIESYPPMGISFDISRLSAKGVLPFVSTLAVTNTTVGLNGTEINCSVRANISNTSMVAAIHVINSGSDVYPRSSLNIINSSEIFMANAITVILEWEQEAGVTYSASIHPATQTPLILTENARLQLQLSYNTLYSVTITATLCGRNSVNYTALNFSYVQCLDTFHETLMHSADMLLEGTNVTFTCPHGQVLVGHNTSTCMGNGEWEPDPREVMCKVDCGIPRVSTGVSSAFIDNSTLEGSRLVFWCNESPNYNETVIATCLKEGRWSKDIGQYSCTTEASNNMHMIILPLVIVSGVILLLLAALIVIIPIIKVRGIRTRILHMNTDMISSQDYHTTSHQGGKQREHLSSHTRTLPPSEYSVIQYSATEELPPDKKERDGSQKNHLVYADIGPRSFKTKNCVCAIDIQSHRVEYAQVNHSAKGKTPKSELKDQIDPVGPDKLINLDSLLIQLQSEVTPKWYEFGEVIGVGKKVLEKYKQYPPEQSIIEILDNWLRNHAGQPTWKEIAEALRKLGLQKLAFDIERVYDTGKLPIEVNMSDIPKVMLSDAAEEIPPPIPPRLLD